MTLKSHKLFGSKPKKKSPAAPKRGPPKCIFCGGVKPGKVFMEGAIVKDGQFVWRFRGVVHPDCAEAEAEKRRRAVKG